jgi:hypothetical protein
MSDQLHAPSALPPGKEGKSGIDLIGGLVGPRFGLVDVEKKELHPTWTRTPTALSSNPYPVGIPTTLSRLPGLHIRQIISWLAR